MAGRPVTSAPNRAPGVYIAKPVSVTRLPGTQTGVSGLSPQQKAAFGQWIKGVTAARNAAPQGVTGAVSPTGVQDATYGTARDTANETFNAAMTANQNQIGQTQLGYLHAFRDLATKNQLQRTHEPYQFVARGILGSGINLDNLEQMDQMQLRGLSDLRGKEAGQVGALLDARNQIESARAAAISRIEQQRQLGLIKMALAGIV